MPNPTFQASPTTRLLRQHLRDVPIGGSVTYAELGALVSESMTGSHPALQSARNSLLRHDRMVFSPIRGEGLKRLTDTEIVAGADQDIDSIRRRSRKAAVKVTAIKDYASLSAKDQLSHTTKLSIFAAVNAMSSDKGIKKVAAAASGRASELPINETLKAFLAAP